MSKALSSANTIKINPEYSNFVTPLSKLEYELLKNSISNKGLHFPIVVNSDGVVLDGHHRYRICKDLGVEPEVQVKKFGNKILEKLFIIDANLKRRHLNNFQRLELECKMEAIYIERAKIRKLSKLKFVKNKLNPSLAQNYANDNNDDNSKEEEEEQGKVSEMMARRAGLSPRTYEKAKVIIEHGTEEVKVKLRNNQTTISKEYKNIQKDLRRKKLLANFVNEPLEKEVENIKLIHGDFIELNEKKIIPDSSVDLIFTDPPYSSEYLYLYEGLADSATRVLKTGGSLVFITGHIILPEVFELFQTFRPDLKYWWTFAVKHSGHHTKIYPRRMFAEWKPMLWYVKGEKVNDLTVSNTIGDYIESIPPSKIEHEWQQSIVEAEYVIKNLTIEKQTVLDPMLGTGTTGIAALTLGRKFIGIEKNQNVFLTTQSSLKSRYENKK